MTMLTRTLVELLVLEAAGHAIGSLKFYKGQPHVLFWALSVSVLIVVVAALIGCEPIDPRTSAWLR